MNVGLVGIGAMGLPMALRLRELGHAVTVRDLDPAREALARGAGCAVAASAAALARRVQAVIVVVVDGAQTREVLFGAEGAANALAAGSMVLLCPTIAPADTEAAAAALQSGGIGMLDAPMSDGPRRARDGTMSLMVAGTDACHAAGLPLLQALSSRLFRVGTRPGDGARTKLVNNLLAAINLAGAAEALALAERLGLDAAGTLAVIEQSNGQSWIGSDRLWRALAGDSAVRARVALLAKDSALALASARAAGWPTPLGDAAAAVFARAVDAGLADADDAALLALARRGGAEIQC
jgi:3-hydroxyisobutyrate dehydrogenase